MLQKMLVYVPRYPIAPFLNGVGKEIALKGTKICPWGD